MAARPNPPAPGAPPPDDGRRSPVVDLRERAGPGAPAGDEDFAVEWQIERPAPDERRRPALV
jgi:hypothetical protein